MESHVLLEKVRAKCSLMCLNQKIIKRSEQKFRDNRRL